MTRRRAWPRRSGRRAAVVTLAVAAVLLLTAGPAVADGPSVTINSPVDKVVEDANEVVTGTARTDPLHTVQSVRVTVRPLSGAEPRSCDAPVAGDGGFACSPGLRVNGPYEVEVTATDALLVDLVGSRRTGRTTASFKVEVAPAPPRDVKVEAGADRRVTISWARNTEPDLKGYQVARLAPGSSSPTVVANVPQSAGPRISAVDATVPPIGGSYRYVVIAVRPDRDGNVSTRATSSSAATSVDVAAAPTGAGGPPGAGAIGPGPGPGAGGAPSSMVTGGPKSALDVSSFLSRTGGAPPSLAVPGGVEVPVDDGSSEVPFAVPGGDIEEESDDSSDPAALGTSDSAANERALFVPIAAGLLLCVLALHLRQFNRTVLDPPAAYYPIADADADDGHDAGFSADDDDPDADDDRPRSRTAALVGAGRPPREG